jgi:hypothetical protein
MKTAVEFLQAIRPGRPWLLTAIKDDGNLETKSFTDTKKCQAWIDYNNGEGGLYYHVNPTPDAFVPKNGGRAKETDIEAVDYLHVDIDPNPRDDLKKGVIAGNKTAIVEMQVHNTDEQERILTLLTTNRPKMVPEPTWIIFSGGGYQAIWKLKQPFKTSGDPDLIKDAKLKNQQLELLFGADKCHNLDRLMRLPFTWNVPNQRKREKAREKVQTSVVKHTDVSYDYEDFSTAVETQAVTTGFGNKVTVSGNIEPIMTVDALDKYLTLTSWEKWRSDTLKVIMAMGNNPEKNKPDDNSRNTWLLHFCCECVRANIPDDVVYSIITDKEWGISESVVERKSAQAIHNYAIRQITRAHEFAIDPKLEELNAEFCVILDAGGRLRILNEYFDESLNRGSMSLMPMTDFMNGHNNKFVEIQDKEGNAKLIPVGKWWIGHPERRQAKRIVFAPAGAGPNIYNLWKGFAAEDVPGDCQLFLNHMRDNICAAEPTIDEDPTLQPGEAADAATARVSAAINVRVAHEAALYEYMLDWLACMIQKPDRPGHTALVLCGDKGVGKGFFVKKCGELVGRHFLQVTNAAHLTGNFNAHLADTLLLFGDEAFYAHDKKHESVLKGIVTEETLAIERKGIDLQTMPNYLHIMLASNDMHSVPASGNERRFVVYDVASTKMQDSDYFANIAKQWDDGGKNAFFNMLRHRDISKWHPGKNAPNSDGLARQKQLSLNSMETWWFEKLIQGYMRKSDKGWPPHIQCEVAYDDYRNWCVLSSKRAEPMIAFRQTLDRLVPALTRKRVSMPPYDDPTGTKVQKWCYHFGELHGLRGAWDSTMQTTNDWDEDGIL